MTTTHDDKRAAVLDAIFRELAEVSPFDGDESVAFEGELLPILDAYADQCRAEGEVKALENIKQYKRERNAWTDIDMDEYTDKLLADARARLEAHTGTRTHESRPQ